MNLSARERVGSLSHAPDRRRQPRPGSATPRCDRSLAGARVRAGRAYSGAVPVRTAADACPGAFALHEPPTGRWPGSGCPAACSARPRCGCSRTAAQDLGDGASNLTSRGNVQLRGAVPAPRRAGRAAGRRRACCPRRPTSGSATSSRRRSSGRIGGGAPTCAVLAASSTATLCADPALARAARPVPVRRSTTAAATSPARGRRTSCWQAPDRAARGRGRHRRCGSAAADAVDALLAAAEAFLALRAADGGTAWRAGGAGRRADADRGGARRVRAARRGRIVP